MYSTRKERVDAANKRFRERNPMYARQYGRWVRNPKGYTSPCLKSMPQFCRIFAPSTDSASLPNAPADAEGKRE
jgi:glucose-6-phosphate isomerase